MEVERVKIIKKIVIPSAFWLLVWQVIAVWVDSDLLLPGPWTVVCTLAQLAGESDFWQATGFTLLRVFAGLAAGTLLGALIAVLTCASRWCDRILSPAVKVIRATPVASFILLVLLWAATGAVPGIISALMVLPVVWGNLCKGIRGADPQLLEMSRAYRFGRGKRIRLIYLPAAAPYFAAGVETSLGLAWKAGVAAEVLCRPRMAVGTQVFFARNNLETPSLFAWTLMVIILSFVVEGLLVKLLRKAVGAYADG